MSHLERERFGSPAHNAMVRAHRRRVDAVYAPARREAARMAWVEEIQYRARRAQEVLRAEELDAFTARMMRVGERVLSSAPVGPVAPGGSHGSRAFYAAGCRCDPCTDANRVYQKNWYKKMKEQR